MTSPPDGSPGPGTGDRDGVARSRPTLRPQGEDVAWSAIGTLVSGPLVWGGIGMLVDRWAATGRIFTVAGVLVGAVTAFWIVYVRFGRGD